MDIIDGTDTRTRIVLGFSRAEFDDLCEQLAGNCFPTGTAGKILRFRSCFTDKQPEAAAAEHLDGSAAVKAMPLVAVSQEDVEDWALGAPVDPTAS